MSIQLLAKAIFITTGPATCEVSDVHAKCMGLESAHYTNDDFPTGTVFCSDKDGNLYARREVMEGWQHPTDSKSWPRAKNGVIPLYRDHWRHIASSREAPYTKALLNAPRKVIKSVQDRN